MAGLQVAAPAAFLGALIGEFAGAERGFGVLTISALRTLETDRVWAVARGVDRRVVRGLRRDRRRRAAAVPVGARGVAGGPAGRRRRVAARRQRLRRCARVARRRRLVLWVAFLRLFDVDPYFAKGPADVWRYLVTEPGAAAQRAEVFDALAETLRTTVLGFAVGMIGGRSCWPPSSSRRPSSSGVLTPVAVALRAVPIVATTPLIILAFGRGDRRHDRHRRRDVVLPDAGQLRRRDAPDARDDCSTSCAPTTRRRGPCCGRPACPSALPAILASARIAVPVSLLGATVAEWLAVGGGMGDLMIVSASLARYDVLWSCVAVLTLTAVVGYGLVAGVEGAILRRYAPEYAA